MEIGLIVIYTDGACLGNPGPGGWGALLKYQGKKKEISGSVVDTTNNRMELYAAIKGLEALKRKSEVTIVTDSKYVQQGMQVWIKGWKERNWLNSSRKPVKNSDLWKRLDCLSGQHNVKWEWIKAHNGHVDNERVDVLAREAAQELRDGK